MRKLVLFVCLFLGSSSALSDPVWVPPKGTLHTSLSYTQGFWDEFLQSGSTSVSLPGEVAQFEFSAYAEYVPMENLAVEILFPIVLSEKKFVYLVTDPSGQIVDVTVGSQGEVRDIDRNFGLGDVALGSKYIFWEKGASLGVRPYIKFPGSYEAGYVVNAPGDGQLDLGLAFLAGVYLPSIRTYARGSLALLHRFEEPNNQMEILLEAGANIFRPLGARFFYQYIEQFGGDEIFNIALPIYFPAVEEDAHRIGVGLSYRATDEFGIFVDFQQTIAGYNTSDTKAFTIGVNLNF